MSRLQLQVRSSHVGRYTSPCVFIHPSYDQHSCSNIYGNALAWSTPRSFSIGRVRWYNETTLYTVWSNYIKVCVRNRDPQVLNLTVNSEENTPRNSSILHIQSFDCTQRHPGDNSAWEGLGLPVDPRVTNMARAVKKQPRTKSIQR